MLGLLVLQVEACRKVVSFQGSCGFLLVDVEELAKGVESSF